MGWYVEYGGRAVRFHTYGSDTNFLALPRWQATKKGIPLQAPTDIAKGMINLDLKGRAGEFYPVPDECLVTDIHVKDLQIVTPSSDGSEPEYGSCVNHVEEKKHEEINIAERYTQSTRKQLMHKQLGHTNMERVDYMLHWDGLGPMPTGKASELCVWCTMAKCHHRNARKLSYQFAAMQPM